MNKPELTDEKIMLITKAALDHNAGIIQMSSILYSAFKDAPKHIRKRWEDEFHRAWKEYNKRVEGILEADDE